MVLAAGRGQRMRPLTDHTPKPLLQVQGKALLEWHLQALAHAGLSQVVINTGWLGPQIPAHLGQRYQASEHDSSTALNLVYSREDLDFGSGIETAGGISRALPQLEEVFWLVAGDVFTPAFVFDDAQRSALQASDALAHVWLVPNPAHNPQGDFTLHGNRAYPALDKLDVCNPQAKVASEGPSYTYSTIALLKRSLFELPWCALVPGNPTGVAAPLGPLLFKAAAQGKVSASLYLGPWTDVGTPERLAALNQLR
ncbi:nucleotidyltransferase family protein [Lampropedia puyangensis]|uniref:Nucleotidyltransferase family protein n=2 Tax=Lampropedia puyangensis TaxID=1330072 RepID=A0A4S8FFL2_9BURK|nr:nucleotidyltransferase family protein [Lampropedia puyangensis]